MDRLIPIIKETLVISLPGIINLNRDRLMVISGDDP